jgi:hypothetical protein
MEQVPVKNMNPELVAENNPENLENNIYIFSSPGECYLAYTAKAGQKIELNLAGENNYKLEVLDTWNMQVIEEKKVEPGQFSFQTGLPYTALKIQTINE